jgi:hypothetical protein
MFGSSRCIAGKLLQFGGPMTLPQAAPSLCVQVRSNTRFPRQPQRITIAADSSQPTADSQRAGLRAIGFCTHAKLRSGEKIIRVRSEMRFLRLREVEEARWAHVQGREATA